MKVIPMASITIRNLDENVKAGDKGPPIRTSVAWRRLTRLLLLRDRCEHETRQHTDAFKVVAVLH